MLLAGFAVLPAHEAEAQATAAQRTLTIALQQDMENFNYFDLGSNSVWKANVIGLNFEGLAGIDYDLQPFPDLATGWTVDAQNLTVTVTLRQGVAFQDGSPMTADDVIFSYYTLRGLKTTYSSFIVNAFGDRSSGTITFDQIKAGVTKVSGAQIRFKMAQAYGAFFTQTLTIPIIPKAIWASHTINETTSTPLSADQGGVLDVTWNTDVRATIGTGPLMYDIGVAHSYRVEKVYQNYWGRDAKSPQGWALFPKNIDTVRFKIYSSLDTAILALQAGDVDHLPWTLTPGQIPVLAANPNVKLTYTKDNGYFYYAFNMKREPMNYLHFRRAVSYLIDKQTIVERYMGGFGQPGDANEPPFWGDGWYNSSVTRYPFDPTFQAAKNELLGNGFTYNSATNSWSMPNGKAIPPLTILTPPATYDPVRVRVGQMVAQNLNAIGISATAQAIDFSLLVARLNAFSYDMLTLGWLLANDPVDNVFFDFGPTDTQNYYGFWSTTHDNPAYSGVGDVSTRADPATQALADQVYQLEQTARSTFDVPTQQKYTKWAEALATQAVPFNVLYYRTNTFATRTSWTGWAPFLGQLWSSANFFSLGALSRSSSTVTPGTVNGRVIVPAAVLKGGSVTGVVLAQDQNGFVVQGASVAVTTTGKTTASPASGTTDANGEFRFTLTGNTNGFDYVNATLSLGGSTATQASGIIEVKASVPATLLLNAVPGSKILNPGASTTITLTVTNEAGAAVSGATVSVDTKILGAGTVTPSTGQVTTDASGHATITYTAPSAALNAHTPGNLVFVATSGIQTSNTAQLSLLTYNTAASVWRFASILGVSKYVLNSSANSTTITVRTTDQSGTVVAGEHLGVAYSNAGLLVNAPASLTTNAAGYANLTLEFKASDTTPKGLRITFRDDGIPNSVSDAVTLLYVDPLRPPSNAYAGQISFTATRISAAFGSLNMTIKLVASDGSTPASASAAVALGSTTSAQLMDLSADTGKGFGLTMNTLDDFAGLLVKTSLDDTSITASGIVAADVDSGTNWGPAVDGWGSIIAGYMGQANYFDNLHSVNVTGGQVTLTLTGVGSALADLANDVFVVPGGTLSYDENALVSSGYSTMNFEFLGQTTLSTQYVVKRNPKILTVGESINRMFMRTNVAYGPNTIYVNVTAMDQAGTPVQGATLRTYNRVTSGGSYRGDDGATPPTTLYVCPGCRGAPAAPTTGASGTASAVLTAGSLSVPVKANLYVRATKSGYLDLFDFYNIYIYPVQTLITITSGVYSVPVVGTPLQGGTEVTVKAVDEKNQPLKNTIIDLTSSQGAVTAAETNKTDANGQIDYFVTLSTFEPATNTIDLSGGIVSPGFSGAQAKVSLVKYTPASSVTLISPTVGSTVADGKKVTIVASVLNGNGIASVKIRVDGTDADYVAQAGPIRSTYWAINYQASSLTPGDHTVYIQATDTYGLTTTQTATFTVASPTNPPIFSSDLAGSLAIAGIGAGAVALVLYFLLRRTGRPKGAGSKDMDAVPAQMEEKR